MREIEFRAWLKKQNKMIKVINLNFTMKNVSDCFFNYYKFDEIELMLGSKIYGDVVVFIGDVVRIYGGEQMFGYYEVDKIKVIEDLEDLVTLFNMDYGIDVLGNIYENPKLLEQLK